MGMSATQARYLSLVAQQSNLEYQGQQINQERAVLSQQVSDLYNSLLAMSVPTPPSTQDYTTIEYAGTDGATTFTLGNIKPSGENYCVEIRTNSTGNALQSNYGSSVVSRAGEDMKGAYVTGTESINAADLDAYYVVEGDKVTPLSSSGYAVDNGDGTYSLKSADITLFKKGEYGETLRNPNAGAFVVAGKVVYEFNDAKSKPQFEKFDWPKYEEAIRNTFGSKVKPEDFYVFAVASETGVESLQFALINDVKSTDGFTETLSFTANGAFTKSEEVDQCKLQFDAQGRITAISIPAYDSKTGEVISYRDINLVATTVTDELAYDEAMAQYEYAQYEYDRQQQEINARTKVIQQQDRNLELKLQRLDTQRTQITTEIEALEKVMNDNIEASYKTFSG